MSSVHKDLHLSVERGSFFLLGVINSSDVKVPSFYFKLVMVACHEKGSSIPIEEVVKKELPITSSAMFRR